MLSDPSQVQARTLWIGEIDGWMNEDFLNSRFLSYGVTPKSVKIIRNRTKGICLGYGFVEFFSQSQAEEVLQTLNNKGILDKGKTFKLNWASDSASKAACMRGLPKNEFTVYVGELDLSVTEDDLKKCFSKFYKSVIGTKIVIDPITKASKGYGFVRFSDPFESQRAINEMNGSIIRGKVCKVK